MDNNRLMEIVNLISETQKERSSLLKRFIERVVYTKLDCQTLGISMQNIDTRLDDQIEELRSILRNRIPTAYRR